MYGRKSRVRYALFRLALLLAGSWSTWVLAQEVPSAGKPDGRTPGFRITNLYEAGEDGYATYRVPAIAVSPSGTVLALCSARKTGHTDWVDTDTVVRRSRDGGETWEKKETLIDDGRNTVDNPTLIVDRTPAPAVDRFDHLFGRLRTQLGSRRGRGPQFAADAESE